MTYRVECEVVSRDPNIAGSSAPLCIGSGRVFEHAQDAVDYARSWVRQFDGSEIPEADRKRYSASDLPRARVQTIPASSKQPSRIVLWVFVNLAGEVVERRHDRRDQAST